MAFQSHAQRDKMRELVQQGKMTQAKYDEMEKGTAPDHELPERKHPKKEK